MNVHIYPSPLNNESRILRITRTLRRRGVFGRVVVLGVRAPNLPEREVVAGDIELERLGNGSWEAGSGLMQKLLRNFAWSVSVVRRVRREKISCVNCHSLSVLPLSVLVKFLKHSRLVYDTHELETETLASRGIRRVIARIIERLCIRFVDEVSVVGPAIGNWYQSQYALPRVWVVRNVSSSLSASPNGDGRLRAAIGVSSGDARPIFLYQGLLTHGRGIALLLQAFSAGDLGAHLVFMGYGPLENLVRDRALGSKRIHFVPAVPPDQVLLFTADANVGLCLIEDACLSYYLSLPNKLFEYVRVGVPVVASDFPEMGAFVREHDCGWAVTPTAAKVASLVRNLQRAEMAAKSLGAKRAAALVSWEREELELLSMYREMGFANNAPLESTGEAQ